MNPMKSRRRFSLSTQNWNCPILPLLHNPSSPFCFPQPQVCSFSSQISTSDITKCLTVNNTCYIFLSTNFQALIHKKHLLQIYLPMVAVVNIPRHTELNCYCPGIIHKWLNWNMKLRKQNQLQSTDLYLEFRNLAISASFQLLNSLLQTYGQWLRTIIKNTDLLLMAEINNVLQSRAKMVSKYLWWAE